MSSKTVKYISPSIKLRELEFQQIMGNIYKESYFIIDSEYYESYNITDVQNIYFIVVNTRGHFDTTKKAYVYEKEDAIAMYKENLKKIKKYKFFVKSYKVKNEPNKEVIVLELPKVVIQNEVQNTALNFLEGKYSMLWTDAQLKIMFAPMETEKDTKWVMEENERRANIMGVLKKDPRFKHLYIDTVRAEFGANLQNEDVKDIELDTPVKLRNIVSNTDKSYNPEIMGNKNILYQLGVLSLKDVKNPHLVTSEDLV
jgi:hypothetical protein